MHEIERCKTCKFFFAVRHVQNRILINFGYFKWLPDRQKVRSRKHVKPLEHGRPLCIVSMASHYFKHVVCLRFGLSHSSPKSVRNGHPPLVSFTWWPMFTWGEYAMHPLQRELRIKKAGIQAVINGSKTQRVDIYRRYRRTNYHTPWSICRIKDPSLGGAIGENAFTTYYRSYSLRIIVWYFLNE